MAEPRANGGGLALDDRRLLVELQSFGVRVEEGAGVPGRRGGAGPSDALFMYVRGLVARTTLRSRRMVHIMGRRAPGCPAP